LYNHRFQINHIFGMGLERQKTFYPNGIPINPLEVGIQATISAVNLVFSLILPQSALLFNYDDYNEKTLSEEAVIGNTNLNTTNEDKIVLRIEKFIMELNYKFFFESSTTDRHFCDETALVNIVLNDRVACKMLYEGYDDTGFFKLGVRQSRHT
jgi:hypothetical protein